GVDVLLVGDSLGMVVLGYKDTKHVTMNDMIRHTEAVARGATEAHIVADMPINSFNTVELALENARRLIKAGAHSVKNRVHALLDEQGFRCPYSDLFGKRSLRWIRELELGSLDRLVLDNHLCHVESLNSQISRVDAEVRRRGSLDMDVRLLLSLTGVGVYSALLIRSEIGDINRFPDYKRLVSWAGLAPRLHQSGSVEYSGGITKQGSKMLRWIMVEAARSAVRHDERMRVFYERVKRRRGDGKAIVAVACKMLKIIWFMLKRREPYQSRNEGKYGDKLKSLRR
ncbi:IS110 family transposase, partial [Candidatus Bathyarchaeota archaeon]